MTHIYERGQLVIPKYFRKLLGWDKGTEVRFNVEGNRLVVEKKTLIADEMEEFARENGVDLKGKTDFDEEYDEGMRKKYKKMGLKF
ncbi:Uncharacterised protein [Candidatus Gugararchaeum adminiculabundum]|nr:Uncharacterised protein [Candidatus Gugararchaeum adminiculabundum]